jgi:hypothetical protein
MPFLINDFLLTSITENTWTTEFLKFTTAALPYTDFEADIFNTGVDI